MPSEFRPASPPRHRLRSALVYVTGAGLAAWTLASGSYILFHDRFLAAMLERQATMQYAYEDRIAELRAALETAGTQAAREVDTQSVLWRDLAARSAKLEAQADAIDTLVGDALSAKGGHRETKPDSLRRAQTDAGAMAARLAALETRQNDDVARLTAKAERAAARTHAALADLGLAESVGHADATGGPFVPLDAAMPARGLAILGEALARQRRLDAAASHLPLRRPVEGSLDVTSGFGARRDPFLGRLAMHTGVDLREDYGSSVSAVAAGTVAVAGVESGYGNVVEIDHGNGYATRYAHLSQLNVRVGQALAAGAVVGQVGTSGRSTGPHLHYEVRIAGEPVDPARYLALAGAIAGE